MMRTPWSKRRIRKEFTLQTSKAGYILLSSEADLREEVWWWKSLWKLKCPAKSKLFMWCVLENRVPTWDILQKRAFHGLGWCVLWKRDQESASHMFLTFPYTVEVWKECTALVGFPCQWVGVSIGVAWEAWWRRNQNNNYQFLKCNT